MSVDSGFHIHGFRIPLSGWILDFQIPDSKAVLSGFHSPKLPGFRITLHRANRVCMLLVWDSVFSC